MFLVVEEGPFVDEAASGMVLDEVARRGVGERVAEFAVRRFESFDYFAG